MDCCVTVDVRVKPSEESCRVTLMCKLNHLRKVAVLQLPCYG